MREIGNIGVYFDSLDSNRIVLKVDLPVPHNQQDQGYRRYKSADQIEARGLDLIEALEELYEQLLDMTWERSYECAI